MLYLKAHRPGRTSFWSLATSEVGTYSNIHLKQQLIKEETFDHLTLLFCLLAQLIGPLLFNHSPLLKT